MYWTKGQGPKNPIYILIISVLKLIIVNLA
jgi:hypothetical protein